MKYFNSGVKCQFINHDTQTLLMVESEVNLNIFEWVKENRYLLEEYLIKYNGVLLRNFGIYSISEFNKVVQIICPNLLDYVYRSTPRTRLGGKIYTATEYPADRYIPFHNENSYTSKWPKKLLFFCVVPSATGGETPISDSRLIYKSLNKDIVKKFEEKRIMYKRNFIPGIDLSWQEVFQTEEKYKVEEFCKAASIDYEWKNSLVELTIKEICQASIKHEITKEIVWFNQAHLFHLSALSDVDQLNLINEFGHDNLPRNAFFGDESSIDPNELNEIRNTYLNNKIEFKWEKGDLMIIDNLLMAHSRNPFEGYRKIAVAMGN